jgi:hypothetical protein
MKHAPFQHPHDTLASGGFRFLSELVAWIAGPWAMGVINPWLTLPTLVVLVGLPAVFSTPGDKRTIIIATPGPARILIEMLQYTVAVIAPWYVWPDWAATISVVAVILSLTLGLKRFAWLLGGAKEIPRD